jgi:hypothetical protein
VHQAPISDSFAEFMYGAYPIVKRGRRYHREIGALPVETEADITNTINETIDASVFERWRANPGYRPPGLARWPKRHGVNPQVFSTTVRANDPKIFAPD